jgi:hypothetical protein
LLQRTEGGKCLRYISFAARADFVYRWHVDGGHWFPIFIHI